MTDSVAKRAAGKANARARTVWTVQIGDLTVRCVASRTGTFTFEAKVGLGKFAAFKTTNDPAFALRLFSCGESCVRAINAAAKFAQEQANR
jgi:hypothetical protein